MPAYVLVDVREIKDATKMDEYRSRVAPTVEKFGDRYLVRGRNQGCRRDLPARTPGGAGISKYGSGTAVVWLGRISRAQAAASRCNRFEWILHGRSIVGRVGSGRVMFSSIDSLGGALRL